ncbi:hypothetical protein OE88DRAFT_1654435 [Heliocybe sulcata]|uniref:Aminoglycoside phosphotransferase domain-containing protein n=1 Tax=Heliocybe sulcata TaxID=5364 RepID=A0A5C3NK62_9AGAM|nr:hypothetical protein OE88DRAFT_1654435 [Heliocybe sulcata]
MPGQYRVTWSKTLAESAMGAVVPSHGDLDPRNVMVRGGGIVATVDWERYWWYYRVQGRDDGGKVLG